MDARVAEEVGEGVTTTEELSTTQAREIFDAMHPTLGFLTQLEVRLGPLGFPPTDEYYRKVLAAREAFHRLTVDTHYLSCRSGVGRPGRTGADGNPRA